MNMICLRSNRLKGSKLSVNTQKPAESGAECGKRICSTTGRLQQMEYLLSNRIFMFFPVELILNYLVALWVA